MAKAKGGRVKKGGASQALTGPGNRPSPKVGVGSRKATLKGPAGMGKAMKMGKPGKRAG